MLFKKLFQPKFLNPHHTKTKRGLGHFLLWQMGYYDDSLPEPMPPENFKYPNPDISLVEQDPVVMWIGHCTFFISVDGINILTDPVWSEHASPLPFFGPKRQHPAPIAIDELPSIDYVLLSHNHYDHLDRASILKIVKHHPSVTFVVPRGVAKWFKKRKIRNVVELFWWEEARLSSKKHRDLHLKLTAVPSQHFSGRGLFDKNRTLWAGFVVDFARKEQSKRLYFVGDTGYNPHDFKAIGKKFKHFDLSLIPIGTYVPRKFMDPVHIDPIRSVSIHSEVNSKLSIGMHWKTFRLSEEAPHQPPYDLFLALQEAEVSPETFRVLDVGQSINW